MQSIIKSNMENLVCIIVLSHEPRLVVSQLNKSKDHGESSKTCNQNVCFLILYN